MEETSTYQKLQPNEIWLTYTKIHNLIVKLLAKKNVQLFAYHFWIQFAIKLFITIETIKKNINQKVGKKKSIKDKNPLNLKLTVKWSVNIT